MIFFCSPEIHVHDLIDYGSAAIATVVTVAEILKNNGLAVEKSEIPSHFILLLLQLESVPPELIVIKLLNAEIMTSTVDIKDDSRGRPVQKAKVGKNI